MCSFFGLVVRSGSPRSNQSMCTLSHTAYKLHGKTCSILKEAWNYKWRLSFPGHGTMAGTEVKEAEIGWSEQMSCLPGSVGYAVAACPQPGSCAFYRQLREATRRERVTRFRGYPPSPVSASVKHRLALFPDLLMKGPVPPQ